MKDTCILVFNENGVVSMRKRSAQLAAGEYAVRIRISVPDRYFDRAIPTVEIDIPEDYIIEPVIGAELLPRPNPSCPHGFEDSDNCPDCRH